MPKMEHKNILNHEDVKYLCDQCDYKATLKTNLLTHIKSKHMGVKYPCDQCVGTYQIKT